MQSSQLNAEAEITQFPQPPGSHRRLVCRGAINWRVAILYDILKALGGGNWLTVFVALGRLTQEMKPDGGSYYFSWRGYLIKVRYDSIELCVNDKKRADLVGQLLRLDDWIRQLVFCVGKRAPDQLEILRSRPYQLRIVHTLRKPA